MVRRRVVQVDGVWEEGLGAEGEVGRVVGTGRPAHWPTGVVRRTLVSGAMIVGLSPLTGASLLQLHGQTSRSSVPTTPYGAPSMFRGDPSHSGTVDAAGVALLGGVAWQFESNGPIRSSPTHFDGTVFFGSSDGRLYAVSADNGRELWSFDAGSAVGSSPAVTRDLVIFGDRNNTWRALERTGGRLIWELPTGPDLPLQWGWEGWDYLAASAVVVVHDGRTVAVFGSGDGRIRGVDALTGEVLWSHTTPRRVRSTPAVVDGTVYVGGGDGVVYALDLETGAQRWTFETEGASMDAAGFGFDRTQIQASPAVVDGMVYIGSRDAWLYALDARDGSFRWHVEDGSAWVVSSAAVADGMVVSGRSSSTNLRGLDARTGAERWVVRTGGALFSSPVVAGSTGYVGTGSGRVLAFDVHTGEERWRFETDGAIHSSPLVVGDRLFVGSDDGTLYALEAASDVPAARAVFWDDSMMDRAAWGGAERHRAATTYFERHGYQVLDAPALEAFLTDRTGGGAPSVVVFGMDALPTAVASGAQPLLRRYLESGGKVVWMGYPPRILARDEEGTVTGLDREGASALLDVDLSLWDSDEYGAFPTDAGRRWGLDRWFVTGPSATKESVDEVLALDELGRAAAWVKRYGGPQGTGFVLVPPTTRHQGLVEIRRVAEFGIFRGLANDLR